MAPFREHKTNSGLKIFGGKDSKTNDELVCAAKPNDILIHTIKPGSPFVNTGSSPSKQDIYEAAIFCAKYSQDWRDNKKNIPLNYFYKKDMKKDKRMKEGSWQVSKDKKIIAKKSDILSFEKTLQLNTSTN